VGFFGVVGPLGAPEPWACECLLTIDVPDAGAVDAAVERARAAGAEVVAEPTTQPWGYYTGTFADLDGHLWSIAAKSVPSTP
jgi:uncharacterized protein